MIASGYGDLYSRENVLKLIVAMVVQLGECAKNGKLDTFNEFTVWHGNYISIKLLPEKQTAAVRNHPSVLNVKWYLSVFGLIKRYLGSSIDHIATNLSKHLPEMPGSLFHPHYTSFGPQFRHKVKIESSRSVVSNSL